MSQPAIAGLGPASPEEGKVTLDGLAGSLAASTSRWARPMRAATRVSVPGLLLVLIAIFLVLQAALSRRDPKLANAPATPDDGTLTFS